MGTGNAAHLSSDSSGKGKTRLVFPFVFPEQAVPQVRCRNVFSDPSHCTG